MIDAFYYIFIACAAFAIKLVVFHLIDFHPILPMDFLAFCLIYVAISVVVQIIKESRKK